MAELIVMEKEGGRMNVLPAKLQEYLDAGWVEVERVAMTSDTPPAESETPEAKPKAPSRKRSAEAADA